MIQLVWFKRDLRVVDNEALAMAAQCGPVLPLYIIESELWRQPDMSLRHWGFFRESLESLRADLTQLGQPLIVRSGEAENVLRCIAEEYQVGAVWSHQETGNGWTFRRDQAIAKCLHHMNVPWHQPRQHGVVRGNLDRDHWSRQWEALMTGPTFTAPSLEPLANIDPGTIPATPIPDMPNDDCPERQTGGRAAAEDALNSFLSDRGERYHLEMSSPLTAPTACSRISAHLACGTLSVREVLQATRARRTQVKQIPPKIRGTWARALSAFEGRLHWHCHFIQKLESEPGIEFTNMQRSMDGLRAEPCDPIRLKAWASGNTGWPFVDACMRSLAQTGWINFRMRAMLVSVACYQLWLHWREPSLHLARQFVDYEPGIHYAQAQMQAGTTGINTLRIYNPIKQSMDQDPKGNFIRRWVPELQNVDDVWIHNPWLMPDLVQRECGVIIGEHYAAPLVDHEDAARAARKSIQAVRRTNEAKAESSKVVARHGSRKKTVRKKTVRSKAKQPQQADLLDSGA